MVTSTPQRLLFTGAHILAPVDDWDPGWLLTAGSRIHLIGPGRAPEFPAGYVTQHINATGQSLLPGFIDLHVHGAVGHEAMDASADGLRAMARFYGQHGVTAFLPTTWTGSREAIGSALQAIAGMVGPVSGGATILGAHLEGPYLNPAKCGAQDPRFIRRADRQEALEWLDTGIIRLLALAPEYSENLWLIDECVRRGVTVSIAHTAAAYDDVLVAAELGVRQATHTFNAMIGLSHREPGTVGAVLALPQVRCELIADGIHVHPAVMKLLVDIKGPDRAILVTDAIRATGMPEGEYQIDDRIVTVRHGSARLSDGTLAGSILTMDQALRNMAQATARPLRELWPMTSLNAARAVGVAATQGSLEVGKDADLVLLDADLRVRLTVAAGTIVYTNRLEVPGVPVR